MMCLGKGGVVKIEPSRQLMEWAKKMNIHETKQILYLEETRAYRNAFNRAERGVAVKETVSEGVSPNTDGEMPIMERELVCQFNGA